MKWIKYGLVILWCLIIFLFSNETGEVSSKRSQSLLEGLTRKVVNILNLEENEEKITQFLENGHRLIRKIAHFTLYFVLSVLVYQALSCDIQKRKNAILYSLLFCLFFAISDEVHQLFIPNRCCSIKDVLIDTLGSATYLGILYQRKKEKI